MILYLQTPQPISCCSKFCTKKIQVTYIPLKNTKCTEFLLHCVLVQDASIAVILKRYYYVLVIYSINPLNAKLNPICHLLALLGAHHILHISRIKVKNITFLV